MKIFPTAFAAQKNLLAGASPVWIFKFTAGGTDYYLSDNSCTVSPWGITTLKWVKTWGQLQEGISGTLNEFRISDFNLDVLTDPDASPNMEALALAYPLEASTVSLYLWFYGCTDVPQEMFRGYIKDIAIPDETMVQLAVQDESLRLERAMIGTTVTLQDYPSADPDDVGKVIPIPFGIVHRLPAMAVNAGIMTSLPAGISIGTIIFAVTSGVGLSAGTVVQVDDEQISIISIGADTIISCTRGINGTVAASHQKGSVLWEQQNSFDYLAAAIPVSSISKVRAILGQTEIDITSVCTRYTGQIGSIHASYPGRAVVTIPSYITASQAVNLLVADGISINDAKNIVDAIGITDGILINDGKGVSDTIGITDGISISDTIAVTETAHNHLLTGDLLTLPIKWSSWNGAGTPAAVAGPSLVMLGSVAGGYDTLSLGNLSITSGMVENFAPLVPNTGNAGTPRKIRWNWSYANGTGGNNQICIFGGMTSGTWITLVDQTWAGVAASVFPASITAGNGVGTQATIWGLSVDVEIEMSATLVAATLSRSGSAGKSGTVTKAGTVSLTGTVSKSGTVALSGNSVANTLVGNQVLCDVVAVATGINDTFSWLLAAAGYPGTFAQIGTWPACYAYNGAITEYQSALYWLNDLAFHARAWFKLSRGMANLIYRPDTLTPAKTLATCRISSGKRVHTRKKTIYDEILNTINVLYNRDWSQSKGASAYGAVAKGSDAASIANYGARERANLFQFDFVTDPNQASDLLSFYLGWYKNRHWLHEFDTFLYDAELEFGDSVTLGFTGNAAGQLLETRLTPGSSTKSDTIDMVVVV